MRGVREGGVCHHFIFFSYIFMIFCSSIGLFSPCRRQLTPCLQVMASDLSLVFMSAWYYHVQCLPHSSLVPVLRVQSLTIASKITQSIQVPHVPLKTLPRQTTQNASEHGRTVSAVTTTLKPPLICQRSRFRPCNSSGERTSSHCGGGLRRDRCR